MKKYLKLFVALVSFLLTAVSVSQAMKLKDEIKK